MEVGIRNSKGEWPSIVCKCGSYDQWRFVTSDTSSSCHENEMAIFKCSDCNRTIEPFKEHHYHYTSG